jgi:GNAT superfamily N-acetyltransferase
MESFSYRTLELPFSDEVSTLSDISKRGREALSIYDQINGRHYSGLDTITTARISELLEDFDHQECHIALDPTTRKVIGTMSLDLSGRNLHDSAWVTGISVDRDYQGLGIGKELLTIARQGAVQRSLGTIALRSVPSAIPFYLKQGFAYLNEQEDTPQPVMSRLAVD